MDSDAEVKEFIEMAKLQNKNLGIILEKEPVFDKALMILSMAVSVDCMDWNDKEEAIEICIQSINEITDFTKKTMGEWNESPVVLEFSGKLKPGQEEWNDMFMDAQGLFRDMLRSHIDAYGPEQIEHVYKETTLCLTYMISIGCARCTNTDDAVKYSVTMIKKTFEFIKEHCKLKEFQE